MKKYDEMLKKLFNVYETGKETVEGIDKAAEEMGDTSGLDGAIASLRAMREDREIPVGTVMRIQSWENVDEGKPHKGIFW